MVDLNDAYRTYLHNKPPDGSEQLVNYIRHYIRPFRLTEVLIFLQPEFVTYGTTIVIEARNLPGVAFKYTFNSRDFFDDRESITQEIAQQYAEWLKTLYVPPGDQIELGEN